MTPYSTWSESRSEASDNLHFDNATAIESRIEYQFQEETTALIEDIIENLMSSSAAQLRKTFSLMEQSREEERQRDQKAYFAGELLIIEQKTTAIVAEALVPILSDWQHSRIINEFSGILKKILPEFAQQNLTISAPEQLHEKLLGALTQQTIEAEVVSSQNAEISVIGSTVMLRADLNQWAQNLSECAAR